MASHAAAFGWYKDFDLAKDANRSLLGQPVIHVLRDALLQRRAKKTVIHFLDEITLRLHQRKQLSCIHGLLMNTMPSSQILCHSRPTMVWLSSRSMHSSNSSLSLACVRRLGTVSYTSHGL